MRKPILYAPKTTNFNNMGIGVLSDAISCTCTQDNGTCELEMEYPVNGQHFGDIRHSAFIKAVVPPLYADSPQLFRIYRISKAFNGIVTISAHHVSRQLSDIPVAPFYADTVGEFFTKLKQNALEDCPFTFATDKAGTAFNYYNDVPTSMMSLLGTDEGALQYSVYGEFVWDNYKVSFLDSAGADNNVEIRYGTNITDLTQEENISETITGVCPFWKGRPETVNEDGTIVGNEDEDILIMLPEGVIHTAYADNFPYQKTATLDLSSEFDYPPTDDEIREYCEAWMTVNEIGLPKVSISVNFQDLGDSPEYEFVKELQRADLYDYVTVIFTELGIKVKSQIVKTTYDVLNERYTSLEIGDEKTDFSANVSQMGANLSNQINKASTVVSNSMTRRLTAQTNLINGGLGGYFFWHKNEQTGMYDELYVMDSASIATAKNVIRFNQGGIGFSLGNGYHGPFTSAWTIDGTFSADFITAGTLNAENINVTNINGENIKDKTIGNAPMADNAISERTVGNGAVSNRTIGDGAVSHGKTSTGVQGTLNQVGTNTANINAHDSKIEQIKEFINTNCRREDPDQFLVLY